MLDHASPEFIRQLAAEGRLRNVLNDRLCPPTSMEMPNELPARPIPSPSPKELPKPRQILLEWSAAKP